MISLITAYSDSGNIPQEADVTKQPLVGMCGLPKAHNVNEDGGHAEPKIRVFGGLGALRSKAFIKQASHREDGTHGRRMRTFQYH